MFKLLTGRAPFAGDSVAIRIRQLRSEQAPSAREFVPDVPANLDQLIAELLKTDPKDRVPTALVLENRLRAIQTSLLDEGQSADGEAT